jgi:hypothetical protein
VSAGLQLCHMNAVCRPAEVVDCLGLVVRVKRLGWVAEGGEGWVWGTSTLSLHSPTVTASWLCSGALVCASCPD